MDQIPATYSTIENSFKGKNIIILKAMSRTTLVKYFIFTSTFNYFLQTWCGARIYFLDSQY